MADGAAQPYRAPSRGAAGLLAERGVSVAQRSRSRQAVQERAPVDSSLQLLLELVEEPPVGALGDDLLRAGLDHPRLAQP